MRENNRLTYTVMIESGLGGFLWVKESPPLVIPLAGSNLALPDNDPADITEISGILFSDMRAWANWYLRSDADYWNDTREIDWTAFNNEGISLARRLKAEVGDDADVQYMRAGDDPRHDDECVTAIEWSVPAPLVWYRVVRGDPPQVVRSDLMRRYR